MPAFDGTGSQGMGPMTGRGLGPCGYGGGFFGKGKGLGFGTGFGLRKGAGFGRGLGRLFGWNWPQARVDQKQLLLDYKKALEEELEEVKKEEENLNKAE